MSSEESEPERHHFAQHLLRVEDGLNAYFRPAEKTSHACLVLHEHLGLVENLVATVENLIGERTSIFIPDLFSAVTSKSLLNNEFDALAKLKYSRVRRIVERSVEFLKQSHSVVLLLGFSIGAAFGLRVLEDVDGFQNGFLFYGLPHLSKINPERIKTSTYIVCGSKDKIKHLSDENRFQEAREKCHGNTRIHFEQINGLHHGFLNPDSPNFSESGLLYCQNLIFRNIPKALKDFKDIIQVKK